MDQVVLALECAIVGVVIFGVVRIVGVFWEIDRKEKQESQNRRKQMRVLSGLIPVLQFYLGHYHDMEKVVPFDRLEEICRTALDKCDTDEAMLKTVGWFKEWMKRELEEALAQKEA